MHILIRPVITEKSLHDTAHGWFTFMVAPRSNKNQIREAVESQFSVHVMSVRTITVAGRTKRVGKRRVEVVMPNAKKALVQLKKGETISLFEVQTK